MKETELLHPDVETWFICWGERRYWLFSRKIKVYGNVLPTQCMNTPHDEVDYYTDINEWLTVLLENGINPYIEKTE